MGDAVVDGTIEDGEIGGGENGVGVVDGPDS